MEVYKNIHEFKGISNSYIVLDKDIFMVDTGMPGNSGKILKYLEEQLKIKPTDISTIVITHGHFDHTGSLNPLIQETGAKVAVHREDGGMLSGEKPQSNSALMGTVVKVMRFVFRIKNLKAEIELEEGDMIGDYRVIHTPGHTSGSICLYNSNNGVIFTGDNFNYSKGKIEAPVIMEDRVQYNKSMKKLENLDITTILTGHGDPVLEDAKEKLSEFLNKNI